MVCRSSPRSGARKLIGMTKKTLFASSLLCLIVARACDLGATFYFDPALQREANLPLLLFGGGWAALLVAALVPSAVAVAGLFVFILGHPLAENTTPELSFSAFKRLWLKRVVLNRHPFRAYLRGGTHQEEGLQAIRLFGVALTWSLIFGSIVCVYAWSALANDHSQAFRAAFFHFGIGRFPLLQILIAFLGFVFGAALFFRSDYLEIKRPDRVIDRD